MYKPNYFQRRTKFQGPRTNHRIKSIDVQVINSSGENLGILPLKKAIDTAKQEGLDLIEISPNAKPPVCKIMDMGKYKYDMQKKANKAKKNQKIAALKERKWSYRIIFIPETLGAIAYCALNEVAMKKIDMGLVVTTVGGPGILGYKQSWQSNHPINRLVEECFSDLKVKYKTYEFDVSAGGHPFWIKTIQGSGSFNQYNEGITNNGASIGKLTFTVPNDAPSTLYYNCQYHGSMTGKINIVDNNDNGNIIQSSGSSSNNTGSTPSYGGYILDLDLPYSFDQEIIPPSGYDI